MIRRGVRDRRQTNDVAGIRGMVRPRGRTRAQTVDWSRAHHLLWRRNLRDTPLPLEAFHRILSELDAKPSLLTDPCHATQPRLATQHN